MCYPAAGPCIPCTESAGRSGAGSRRTSRFVQRPLRVETDHVRLLDLEPLMGESFAGSASADPDARRSGCNGRASRAQANASESEAANLALSPVLLPVRDVLGLSGSLNTSRPHALVVAEVADDALM